MKLKAGIVASSGGSALAAAHQCIVEAGHSLDIVIATDRECGASRWAIAQGFDTREFASMDRSQLSKALQDHFARSGCLDVLLFYSRILEEPFITTSRVCNIHPSLLPAFPGLHAIERAHESRVRLVGATLHRVDNGMDTGAILAQVATPVKGNSSVEDWQRLSYRQKVWLTLVWYERLAAEDGLQGPFVRSGSAAAIGSPGLADLDLLQAFLRWERVSNIGS